MAVDPELSALLDEIVGPHGRFGHPEHVRLAVEAVRRHGHQQARDVMARWITQLAVEAGDPDKYHATRTRAWVDLVAAGHPDLLDKDLLSRFWSDSLLGSTLARRTWVEPDLQAWGIGSPAGTTLAGSS